jgi:hypothetical protein
VFGFDDGRSQYRQPGQDAGTVMVQGSTNDNANTRDGLLGFFARMFSESSSLSSRSSSSGYLQPAMSSSGDVMLCQPVEGAACQPMEAIACQPVEGIACQPVMMVPVPGPMPGP